MSLFDYVTVLHIRISELQACKVALDSLHITSEVPPDFPLDFAGVSLDLVCICASTYTLYTLCALFN